MVNATTDNALDWSKVFLKGMSSFRWMNRYLKSLNISELDVKISLEQDIAKNKDEIFIIAYYNNAPMGIIRASEYWLTKAHIIPSHYPLVLPKVQRKGIGELLVKEIIKQTQIKGDNAIWAETWSRDKRELQIYQSFYEKINFNLQSNRSEMSILLENYNQSNASKSKFEIISKSKITNDFVLTLSKSYSKSLDKLHVLEELGKKKICRDYLEKISRTFHKLGFILNYQVVKIENKLCAALMTATSSSRGIIMEVGVVPSYRKMGIGKRLVTGYLDYLKNQEIPEAVLAVDLNNTPAIDLYQKFGFEHNWFGKMFLMKITADSK
jgi:ribosomal protein S18 acetylase RimI-like enzyme